MAEYYTSGYVDGLEEDIKEYQIQLAKLREWVVSPPKKTVVETFYVDTYIDVEEFLEWWRRGKDIILNT